MPEGRWGQQQQQPRQEVSECTVRLATCRGDNTLAQTPCGKGRYMTGTFLHMQYTLLVVTLIRALDAYRVLKILLT
jgi:hypothetical protein